MTPPRASLAAFRRPLAWLDKLDRRLRVRAPRVWALKLPYLALAVVAVPAIAALTIRWLDAPSPWLPRTPPNDTSTTLGFAVAATTLWGVMSARARRSLPRAFPTGWMLGTVGTVGMLAMSLVVAAVTANISVDAANRAAVCRDDVIADAAALGYLTGAGRVGEVHGEFGCVGQLDCEAKRLGRLCKMLTASARFDQAILRYVVPDERASVGEELAHLRVQCADEPIFPQEQADRIVALRGLEKRVYALAPFSIAHGLGPEESPFPRGIDQALWIVLALELTVLGTVTMSLTLNDWDLFVRMASALTAVYVAVTAIADNRINDLLLQWLGLGTLLACAGWLLAIVAGLQRRRSAVTDHALAALLLAPVLLAALATASVFSTARAEPGWVRSELLGLPLWLPRDRALQRGFCVSAAFVLLSPIVHILVERYRMLRSRS